MDEIKKCPYCGGKTRVSPMFLIPTKDLPSEIKYYVECCACGTMLTRILQNSEDKAIEVWNKEQGEKK